MPNHAQCTIVGHLGQDPEQRNLPNGDPVVNFSIATTRKRKDGDVTTWWRCAMFGKRASVITQYLKKGDPILVTGEPHMRGWTDQAGAQRQSLEVDVRDFAFVGGKGDQQQAAPPRQTSERMDPQNRASMAAQAPAGATDDFDNEIPFGQYERGWVI